MTSPVCPLNVRTWLPLSMSHSALPWEGGGGGGGGGLEKDPVSALLLHTHTHTCTTKLKFVSALLYMLFPMVSFLAEIEIFTFWPKTLDYSIVRHFALILYTPITPHWKVLRSSNLHHSATMHF